MIKDFGTIGKLGKISKKIYDYVKKQEKIKIIGKGKYIYIENILSNNQITIYLNKEILNNGILEIHDNDEFINDIEHTINKLLFKRAEINSENLKLITQEINPEEAIYLLKNQK